MKEQRYIIRYYKKKLRHGRGAFSRAVDYFALRIMAFVGCYLYFASFIMNNAAKVILSIAATGFLSVSLDLVSSLRLDSFVKAERKRAAKEELDRRLLFLSHNECMVLIRSYIKQSPEKFTQNSVICPLVRAAEITADDVIAAARQARERKAAAVALFHVSKVTPEAKSAASSCPGIKLEFIDMRTTLSEETKKRLMPTDAELDRALMSSIELEKQQKKAAASVPFGTGRTRRYIFAAVCLTALSFFVDYALYYRLMAAACICLGATSWWLSRA